MHDIKDLISVLAPFLSSLVTLYLSDRRSNKKDDRDYIQAENKALLKENRELRAENSQLRKELSNEAKR